MSAFLVSQECMQRAIAGVDQINRAWMGDYQVKGFGHIKTEPDLSRLGTAFFEMNDDALSARYDDKPSGETFKVKPMNSFGHTIAAGCSRLKALQCLHYQCSEGHVPETELYQGLEKVIGDLATAIVDELPEYTQATWG